MKKFIYKYNTKLFLISTFIFFSLGAFCSKPIRIIIFTFYCIYVLLLFLIYESQKDKFLTYYYNRISAFRTTYNREPTDEEEDKMYKDALDTYYKN